jgi:hypothetical protein
VAHSIPSLRVIRVIEQLIELYGKPRALRLDNGPELTSVAFTEWCMTQSRPSLTEAAFSVLQTPSLCRGPLILAYSN